MRICVLGSGSGGNCTLVEAGGFRILIDAARLGQRYIVRRLQELGTDIHEINAILGTHLHGDHVDGSVTYPLCRKHGIPLYIHTDSFEDLVLRSHKFTELDCAGLVRRFSDTAFPLRDNLWVRPFHVRHGGDGWNRDTVGRPVGFRITYIDGPTEKCLAYATDLGVIEPHVEDALTDVDAIVIESNHDPELEAGSSRPRYLVNWVTGPHGHLSNEQAAVAIAKAVKRSDGRTKHVFLAHLSKDCNTPDLARSTALHALEAAGAPDLCLHRTAQREPSEVITI